MKIKQIALQFIALLNVFSFQLMAQKQNNNKPVKSSQASYEKYIDDNNDTHLKELMELVSIQGISSIPANKPDVDKAATRIMNKLKIIGMTTAQTIPTDGNPIVYGSWDKAPGKPNVLIYAHHDVQPVKESEWMIPPEKLHFLINKY